MPTVYQRSTAKMVNLENQEKSSQRVAKIPINESIVPSIRVRIYNLIVKLSYLKPSSKVVSFLTNQPLPQHSIVAESSVQIEPLAVEIAESSEPAIQCS